MVCDPPRRRRGRRCRRVRRRRGRKARCVEAPRRRPRVLVVRLGKTRRHLRDRDVVDQVREMAIEDPVLAVDGRAVEDLDEDLGVVGVARQGRQGEIPEDVALGDREAGALDVAVVLVRRHEPDGERVARVQRQGVARGGLRGRPRLPREEARGRRGGEEKKDDRPAPSRHERTSPGILPDTDWTRAGPGELTGEIPPAGLGNDDDLAVLHVVVARAAARVRAAEEVRADPRGDRREVADGGRGETGAIAPELREP